jgi:UDP:flavonoid glycosyltransferase YjiC (YdhE family)
MSKIVFLGLPAYGHAVPLILIPQQLEQLLNAHCVEKHDAGLIIDKQVADEHPLF